MILELIRLVTLSLLGVSTQARPEQNKDYRGGVFHIDQSLRDMNSDDNITKPN